MDLVLADPLPALPNSTSSPGYSYTHAPGQAPTTTYPRPNPATTTTGAGAGAGASPYGPGVGLGAGTYAGGGYGNGNGQWPSPSNYSSTPSQLHPGYGGNASNGKERALSQMTAFTDLMETAGFRKGEPFLANNNATGTTGKRR